MPRLEMSHSQKATKSRPKLSPMQDLGFKGLYYTKHTCLFLLSPATVCRVLSSEDTIMVSYVKVVDRAGCPYGYLHPLTQKYSP